MINPYAAGAKVYNGGSSAATMGTVDPMGYINRGITAIAKPKLPTSQTRSGLAQAALNKIKQNKVTTSTQAGGYQLPGFNVQPLSSDPTPTPAAPAANTGGTPSTGTGSALGSGGDAPSVPVPGDAQPAQAPAPLVGITPTGQVQLNLPFEYDLADQRVQGLNQYNTLLNTISDAMNKLQTNNYQQGRQLDYAQQDDQRGDLNRFAARGLARSSGYGQEVANSTRDFSNSRNDLLDALTQGKNELQTQQNSGAQGFNDLLASLARQQAERDAAKAGDLHLNDPPVTTPPATTPTDNTTVPVNGGWGSIPVPKVPSKLPSGAPGGAVNATKPKLPPAPKKKAAAKKPAAKKKATPKPPVGAISKF